MSEVSQLLNSIRADIRSCEGKLNELRTVEKYMLEKLGIASVSELNGAIPHKMTQVEAARKVLESEPLQSMTTNQIAQAIIKRGYCPDAPSLLKLRQNLFSIMRKTPDVFLKIGPGVWADRKSVV